MSYIGPPLEVALQVLKALADEKRLMILGLLNQRPHNVGELAQALDLTEPTVSHHLAKLREVGLLNLYARGTQRIYRLNTAMLSIWKGHLNHIEEFYPERHAEKPPVPTWIDDLDGFDEAERKVLRDYCAGDQLRQIPTKEKKLRVVLRWLVTLFAPGQRYTEAEINAILSGVHEDYASLRRELVELGFLARADGGRQYWRVEH